MSKNYNLFIRPLIFTLDPEKAHNLVIQALKLNFINSLIPASKIIDSSISQTVFNLTFENPVGLAAGFDKNAEIVSVMPKFGFGFAELGTVTPKEQFGNPKPRIFRLIKHKAVINALGFNNKGAETFAHNLMQAEYPSRFKVGINIGKNKDSDDYLADYLFLLEKFYSKADYITVNISSPNTPGLRQLQHNKVFEDLVSNLKKYQAKLAAEINKYTPILIKISSDNNEEDLEKIAEATLKHQIDGLIISNTTINERENLEAGYINTIGGLSGNPLFPRATRVLEQFYKMTKGQIPLIGVGGIMSGEQAYQKILKGASLIQLYTGLIYNGFGLVNEINKYIIERLRSDGFKNISEAIGKGV